MRWIKMLGWHVLLVQVCTAQTTVTIDVDPIGDGGLEPGCSLREAISLANSGLMEGFDCTSTQAGMGQPVSYEIILPEMRYTLLGDASSGTAGGDLDVDSVIVLRGAGSGLTVIEGSGQDRVFHLTSANASLTLRDLEITGGAILGAGTGAGIKVDAGVLDLERVTLRNNRAIGEVGRPSDGGAIANQNGSVRIGPASLLLENRATRSGGAIYSLGPLTIDGATLERNTATRGGAVYASGPNVNIENCVVRGNSAVTRGGGLSFRGDSLSVAVVKNCTIVNNSADEGGGIRGSYLDLANSTVAFNRALSEDERPLSRGGGLLLWQSRLTNVTVFANSAEFEGGGLFASGTVVVANTLLADNEALSGNAPDCGGLVQRQGVNLVSRNNGCSVIFPGGLPNANGDLVGTTILPLDPGLAPLAGTPPVLLPGAGSIVVDAVGVGLCTYAATSNNGLFSDGDPVQFDQRGVPRDSLCDIGAIESDELFTNGFEGN
ncbi:MAG: right-handed parallel beta-helix repeat-containing protein [Pseudomonadota bacterium]